MSKISTLNSNQCYKLLGLNEGASIDEIKIAYRRLALEYHPDKNISAKDGTKFKIITEAYNTLRIKNNVHGTQNIRTEHQTKNENLHHKKNNSQTLLYWFYSKMNNNYIRYAKNIHRYYLKFEPTFSEYSNKLEGSVHRYYLKFEPTFSEYSNKLEKNTFILVHHSVRLLQNSRIRTIKNYIIDLSQKIHNN